MIASDKENPELHYSPISPYITVLSGDYDMRADYHIYRSGKTTDHLLFLTLSGAGILEGYDGPVRIPSDSIAIYEPGASQNYYTDPSCGKWHFQWLHFRARASWLSLMDWDSPSKGVRVVSLDDFPSAERRRIKAIIAEAVRYARDKDPLSSAFAANYIENALLRIYSQLRSLDKTDWQFKQKADAFIQENLKKNLSVAALSGHFKLSQSRFAHRFTETFGVSPQIYVEACRLDFAKNLLLSSATCVKEAAYESGFSTPSYFCKRFILRFGMPPSDLLANQAEEQEASKSSRRNRRPAPAGGEEKRKR